MSSAVLHTMPLGVPWPTIDPFLFCVHHHDAYPAGNGHFGPAASLQGRDLGQDFEGIDGWRMYHGMTVPGFPQHPHRGFETVTYVRRGLIDHSDSLGAAARFGRGDVQWLTAGAGIVHSEMFPLLDVDGPNPLELFQIWLNLPANDKMVEPYFSMLWDHMIPRRPVLDAHGRSSEITVVAGRFADAGASAPPPDSWAARADSDVAIWHLRLDSHAEMVLPPAQPGSNRVLYLFQGPGAKIDGTVVGAYQGAVVQADVELPVVAGDADVEALVLQGRPIGEPVAQYGPFVMNNRAQIQQAFEDYQRTAFGGWPWPDAGPLHGADAGRFARHADGRIERVDAHV